MLVAAQLLTQGTVGDVMYVAFGYPLRAEVVIMMLARSNDCLIQVWTFRFPGNSAF